MPSSSPLSSVVPTSLRPFIVVRQPRERPSVHGAMRTSVHCAIERTEKIINCQRLVGTTLLKESREDMSYLEGTHLLLNDEICRRHILVVELLSGKTVQIDTSTHRRKKGLAGTCGTTTRNWNIYWSATLSSWVPKRYWRYSGIMVCLTSEKNSEKNS
jgi:hypothetical protein